MKRARMPGRYDLVGLNMTPPRKRKIDWWRVLEMWLMMLSACVVVAFIYFLPAMVRWIVGLLP